MTEPFRWFPARRGSSSWIATFALAAAAGGISTRLSAQGINEYPAPSSGPNGIVSVGNLPDTPLLVFTETSANRLAGIGYDGAILGELDVPTAASQPWGLAVGPDGNIWFTELAGDQIGHITNGNTITEFPIPTAGSHPWGITAGPDGALWFTETGGNKIGRITTAGVVTEFPIPTASSAPRGIVAGPDGALWFVEHDGNRIGRVTTAGVVTEFPVPTASAGPHMIASGTDGNLWFTEHMAGKIGRITPAGVITEFPLPSSSSAPFGITSFPDGNVWFTEETGNQVGRITGAGVITEVSIPTASSAPRGIAVGHDGDLWFAESAGNRIARGDTRLVVPSGRAPVAMTPGPDFNLWFTEAADTVARATNSGLITEFATPTPGALGGITAGPDGNLWFAEIAASKLARVTPAGAITEFPVPNPPSGITLGPDNNLWFTEPTANKIGTMTTAGAVTEYPVPTLASGPTSITSAGGALWFTEVSADKFGKITTAGVVTEYPLPATGCGLADIVFSFGTLWSACSNLPSELRAVTLSGIVQPWFVDGNARHVAAASDLNIWYGGDSPFLGQLRTGAGGGALHPLPESGASPSVRCLAAGTSSIFYGLSGSGGGPWIGRYTHPQVSAAPIQVDAAGNGVFDPGETVTIATSWRNWQPTTAVQAMITSFTGPAGATYTIDDSNADHGVIGTGASGGCGTSTGDCYQLTVSNPAVRPQAHWDANFIEDFTSGGVERRRRGLHIGGSFADVPSTAGTYRFVETLFHFGVTAGCGGGNYCPGSNNTRAQMAVFLLVAANPVGYAPPPCATPVFNDVPCSSGFAPWVNELAARGVTAGCGNNNYCPNDPVTRGQMAVFLLRTKEGNAYTPPACVTPTFADVPCSSGLAVWINELARRGITAGCGGGNYCPANPVTRGQMAVFLTTTFGLTLYGP